MLLSVVSVLVVVQSSSEVPEGLMNNPVYSYFISRNVYIYNHVGTYNKQIFSTSKYYFSV